MPAPFQGDSFTERFLSAFDDIIAPVLTTLDTIDAYLDPWLTPPDFLPWLAGWVGAELDENWSEQQQRRLVATAVDLLQWRGTRRGTVELIRGRTGRMNGLLQAGLTMMKGLPSGYNRDFHEEKEILVEALDLTP
jgi:phage tail-like protein